MKAAVDDLLWCRGDASRCVYSWIVSFVNLTPGFEPLMMSNLSCDLGDKLRFFSWYP